jgi:hypothetical protein
LAEPLRILAEPLRIMAEPLRIMAEPVRILAEPLRIMTEPLRIMAEPLRIMAEPLRIVAEPLRIVAEPAINFTAKLQNNNVTGFDECIINDCVGSKIEKNEMGGACGTYGEGERCAQGVGGET